jgi:hypothetical protein
MDALRGLYVSVLSAIILLSGCFGSGVFDDAEGQTDEDGTGGTTNIAPLIEVIAGHANEGTPIYSPSTGELEGYSEWNVTLYRAITDLDGTIVSAGWDFDLDGQIDYNSTAFRAVDELSIPSSNWVDASPGANQIMSDGAFEDYQIATIAFIATDDDGATSGELLTINNLPFYVEGDDPNDHSSTLNTYTADDAADDASAAGEGADTLIRLQMTGSDDLEWDFVIIRLSVGADNIYTCSVAAGDDCTITQAAGSNDNAWESGEYIFLAEGALNICSEQGCMVDITVLYQGNAVAGDSAVVVN